MATPVGARRQGSIIPPPDVKPQRLVMQRKRTGKGRSPTRGVRRGDDSINDRRTTPMTDVDTLIRRIDQELGAEVQRQKANWAETVRIARERESRLQRYDAVGRHVIDLLKPRLAAFLERFKDVVKAEPSVREHTRAVNLSFAATVAKVTLRFEVFPDREVNHARLECTQEIVP